MNLTILEEKILKSIATSEYNQVNGSIPETVLESVTYLWVDELADDNGLTMNQVKGVLSSLVKKEMIYIDVVDHNEHLVRLTEKGIEKCV